MSAIAGIVCLDHGQVESEAAERMAALLAWRGPDDEGSYRSPDGRVALAARRLAIVDGSAEAGLPLANETHDIWLVLDGFVLNHRTLRHSLELVGHRFRSGCDAEVALHAYEQWGLDFLTHLQGAFALALWDDLNDRLVLARDRMGRKPLYLAEHCGRLGFASAIRPLLDELGMERRLDPAGLAQHLAQGWVAAPGTLVAGIAKLGPGEMVVLERGTPPLRSRWGSALPADRRAAATRGLALDRQIGNLRTLLDCAVADRMAGDGMVAVRLDPNPASGAVAAVMARLAGRRPQAFAVVAEDDESGGARTVRALAAAARCDLAEVTLSGEAAAAAVAPLAARLSEPVADPSALAVWTTAQAAGDAAISALLASDGAGEVLLSHPSYDRVRRNARIWRLSGLLPRFLRRRRGDAAAADREIAAAFAPFGAVDMPGLLEPGGPGLPLSEPATGELPGWLEDDPLAAAGWRDLAGRGAESLCLVGDSATLAHGVECRLPFLDETLVAYALAMPGRQRAPAAASAQSLRRLLTDLLPAPLAGIEPSEALPLELWMAGPLGSLLETTIATSGLFRSGVLAAPPTRALLAEHRRTGGRARPLWALLMLAQWCDALGIDGIAGRQPAGELAGLSG